MYIPAWPSLNPAYFLRSNASERLPFPLTCPGNTYFYVARNGIYHLMQALALHKGGTVLVPDYHHGNEIFAIRATGVKVRYYPIRKTLDADLNAISELIKTQPRALYVTHFIGWPQPMAEIQALCRDRGVMLIEDCALSFMSESTGKPLGTFGDYSIFCLYKTVPLPNGGVLVRNDGATNSLDELELQCCDKLSVAGRSIELMLQWLRSNHGSLGGLLFALKRGVGRTLSNWRMRRVPVGDTGFNVSAARLAMSPICHMLLQRFQYHRIKEIRRRNFLLLQERLRGHTALLEKDLSEGVCPLFFPLLVSDKAFAARVLKQRGIQTVEFWNRGDPEANVARSDAAFLRRHLLEVPIHQDVTPDAADYIAEQILRLKVGLPE